MKKQKRKKSRKEDTIPDLTEIKRIKGNVYYEQLNTNKLDNLNE